MNKLNIGCGNLPLDGYINHDLVKHCKEIDVEFDLNLKDWAGVLKEEFIIRREITWEDFDEIRAWDVIEHLEDPINFMDNCWDLLKKGGILHLKACGYQNESFYIDITHKKGYHIKSFDYFDPDTEIGKEYGYYTDKRWKILEKAYDRKFNVIIKLTPRGK